jgi:hypothetical protein
MITRDSKNIVCLLIGRLVKPAPTFGGRFASANDDVWVVRVIGHWFVRQMRVIVDRHLLILIDSLLRYKSEVRNIGLLVWDCDEFLIV